MAHPINILIHVDDPIDRLANSFLSTLRDLNFHKNDVGPTHVSGQTLNLIIIHSTDHYIRLTKVGLFSLMSDHNSTAWCMQLTNVLCKTNLAKNYLLRKIKTINHDRMDQYIWSSGLFLNQAGDFEDLVEQ